MEELKPRTRVYVEIIEFLRGVAAIGVVSYHFANSTLPTIKPNPMGDFFEWAKLGIPVFFIISGFVIPYAMYTAGYRFKDAGRFFIKRMVRMAPPAWVAIFLMFIIYYGGLYLNGRPIEGMDWPGVSPKALISNFLFSFELVGVEKYNPMYWTLEVECQFYIIIALLLPLILYVAGRPFWLSVVLIAFNLTYYLYEQTNVIFFRDNSFFLSGILLFLFKMKLISRNYFAYAMLAVMFACYIQQGV